MHGATRHSIHPQNYRDKKDLYPYPLKLNWPHVSEINTLKRGIDGLNLIEPLTGLGVENVNVVCHRLQVEPFSGCDLKTTGES